MCIYITKWGKNYLDQANDEESVADPKYKTTHKPDIQSKHELTLAQEPGIHTAWTWPVSCLCPPSKTAAGSHGGGCSCQTLVEQLSQDHLLPADQKQKWHATENDPPILISFLELTYDAKPPEYESEQKHTHTEDTHIQFWVGGSSKSGTTFEISLYG